MYLIFWTYVGNYAERPMICKAGSFEEAAAKGAKFWGASSDFAQKATIHVASFAGFSVDEETGRKVTGWRSFRNGAEIELGYLLDIS